MQVHNQSGKTIFALNGWLAGQRSDLGIGNGSTNSDWTLMANASTYSFKRLRVYVRPTTSTPPNGAVAVAQSGGAIEVLVFLDEPEWHDLHVERYGSKAEAELDLSNQLARKTRRVYATSERYVSREAAMQAAKAVQ